MEKEIEGGSISFFIDYQAIRLLFT